MAATNNLKQTDKKHIALLIPSTSRGRDNWSSIKDTYLMNMSVKTFLLTQNKEHRYTFYIGCDADDRILSQSTQQDELRRFSNVFKNVDFKFIHYTNIQKGHLTKMWNVLFKQSYDDGCDYFYQCGDDIVFKTSGWVNDCIKVLKEHDDIGLAGPINNNSAILTQAFVSRKHMDIFGWFFPEEIINWCCDDWYNHVYRPNYFYPLRQHFCSNEGGQPRYVINNDRFYNQNAVNKTRNLRENANNLAAKHKLLIERFIKNNSNIRWTSK